jgi:hypothetical protein
MWGQAPCIVRRFKACVEAVGHPIESPLWNKVRWTAGVQQTNFPEHAGFVCEIASVQLVTRLRDGIKILPVLQLNPSTWWHLNPSPSFLYRKLRKILNGVLWKSNAKLLLWLQNHCIHSEFLPYGVFVKSILCLHLFYGTQKIFSSETKVSVSLHKTFCESLLLPMWWSVSNMF